MMVGGGFYKVFDHVEVATSARQHRAAAGMIQGETTVRRSINDLIAAAIPLFSSMKLT